MMLFELEERTFMPMQLPLTVILKPWIVDPAPFEEIAAAFPDATVGLISGESTPVMFSFLEMMIVS